jgi:hypothetical protein
MIVFCLLLFSSLIFAQDEEPKYGWQKEATAALNLTQSTFDNYAAGGENSTAWQFRLGLKFVNEREKFNWANTGKFDYGQSKIGKDDFKKSTDELKIESVFTPKVWKTVNPYVSVTAETQFDDGFKYTDEGKIKVSELMDPGYIRESIGMSYKPNAIIQARMGAAMKQVVADQYGESSNEVGGDAVVDLNYKIAENSQVKSKLEIFSNFVAADEIDVSWDTDISAKITKFIAFNFNVKLVYDKDVSAKRQLKQVMGIGVSYSFL